MEALKLSNYAWFDLLAVAVLTIGMFHGKKTGMSHELLNTLKWLAAVAVCGVAYEPAGKLLLKIVKTKPMYCHMGAYLILAAAVAVLFSNLKKKGKERFSGADVYGRWEYPLGMLAGMFQYFCMLVLALAILHAKPYDAATIEYQIQEEEKLKGKRFQFPKKGRLQYDVFTTSNFGRTISRYCKAQMIKPVKNVPGQ